MKKAEELHRKYKGKIELSLKFPLNKETLSLAYTPGVADVSLKIFKNKKLTNAFTNRGNTIAIVTDGSAVLGLGNIGPEAALPVMEGKAVLFKEFADIDAIPILLNTQDTEEIIQAVKNIAPSFSGINLEDISAPRCFEIEKRLDELLPIPVFHDDQHGTAIVVLAGLINALKVTKKSKDIKIIISGAGAAGLAIANILNDYGFKNFCLCDSGGVVTKKRNDINSHKKITIKKSVATCPVGFCTKALEGADVFIGVSKPNVLTVRDIRRMNKNSIIFALANPAPEILPYRAKKAGAIIVATGRSDFINQINNALVFPGVFRGALDSGAKSINNKMKIAAARALADYIKNPAEDYIIPNIFDKKIVNIVAKAVSNTNDLGNP